MKSVLKCRIIQVLIAIIVINGTADAQIKDGNSGATDLYNEIKLQDSLLFASFNSRDIDGFKKYFSKDLEFFHDKGGLTDYNHTVNFLIETAKQKTDLRRDLVEGTLEVYPIPGYGAMEIGSHRFCHDENGRQDCGIFKFVQVWQKKDDQWIITRVVSYGH